MSKRPRILTLIILTLLPCALLTLRWYSFHAFDYLLYLRGTDGHSILLRNSTVQLESATDFHRAPVSPANDYQLIPGRLFAGHAYGWPAVPLYRGSLAACSEDLDMEIPAHDWQVFAFGASRHEHLSWNYDAFMRSPPLAPPTLVRYLQLPLWPVIALATLLALRKWWHFLKSTRHRPAFPVEPAIAPNNSTLAAP